MGLRQRLDPAIECGHKVWQRSSSLLGLSDDGGNCGQRIFDAVVEFSNQQMLLLLHLLPLGYVDADTEHPLRVAVACVRDETARLDPTLHASTIDTILHAIFAPARIKGLAPGLFHLPYVVGMHVSQALAARYLGRALWKAVNGRIALRNLHDLRVGVIRVAADASRLPRQSELQVALGQLSLCLFAVGDVARNPKKLNSPTVGVAHDGAFERCPTLLGKCAAASRSQTVFDLAAGTGTLGGRKGCVQYRQVGGMNEGRAAATVSGGWSGR